MGFVDSPEISSVPWNPGRQLGDLALAANFYIQEKTSKEYDFIKNVLSFRM
jgi:hypothetical protein